MLGCPLLKHRSANYLLALWLLLSLPAVHVSRDVKTGKQSSCFRWSHAQARTREHREAVRATGYNEAKNGVQMTFFRNNFLCRGFRTLGSIRTSMLEIFCGFNFVFLDISLGRRQPLGVLATPPADLRQGCEHSSA